VARPIVITGGGTGGHIFPMSAIAEALHRSGVPASDLRFVGSRRGQEQSLLGGGPVALTLLPGRGIRRSLQPRALLDNVVATGALALGFVQALGLVASWRPRAVVSVGGYASFPVSLAAVLLRRPLLLVNLAATPPAPHRLLARFATVRCEALGEQGPGIVVTGAPVRDEIVAVDRSVAARQAAKAALLPSIDPSRTVVVVMTGSLGAASVNRAVSALASTWRERNDITLVHITGRRDASWVVAERPETTGLDYRIEPFAHMPSWWQVADAAVCRAGATTVAELTVLGIPSVLVPLPGAPGDHQTANAQSLVAAGAAVMIRDSDVSATTLAAALTTLLDAPTSEQMGRNALALGRPHAADAIAAAIREVSA